MLLVGGITGPDCLFQGAGSSGMEEHFDERVSRVRWESIQGQLYNNCRHSTSEQESNEVVGMINCAGIQCISITFRQGVQQTVHDEVPRRTVQKPPHPYEKGL